jgi:hypothetical protein
MATEKQSTTGEKKRERPKVARFVSRQVDSQNEACITVIGTNNKQQLIFNQHGTGKPRKKHT